MSSIVDLVRSATLDAELGALIWALADAGVPIHVAAADADVARGVAAAIAPLSGDPGIVSWGGGAALEDVLRQPVPLRPATGVVVILRDNRVVAAHLQRPPLRDAGGHVRPQGPAVLATWDERLPGWEHFAWGVTPELADAAQQRPGDFEIEQGRRRDFLRALAASALGDDEVRVALGSYGIAGPPQ